MLARARTGAARKGPGQLCPGGARGSRSLAAPGGGRAAGLEAEDSVGAGTPQLAGDTANVTQTGACGSIGLGRAPSAVPAQAPCRGENAAALPPVHFHCSLVSPHVTSASNSLLKAE